MPRLSAAASASSCAGGSELRSCGAMSAKFREAAAAYTPRSRRGAFCARCERVPGRRAHPGLGGRTGGRAGGAERGSPRTPRQEAADSAAGTRERLPARPRLPGATRRPALLRASLVPGAPAGAPRSGPRGGLGPSGTFPPWALRSGLRLSVFARVFRKAQQRSFMRN